MVKWGTLATMTRVNVGELKANLSRYLRAVRAGEGIVVCDRNRPIARLVPFAEYDASERERAAAAGVLTVREGADQPLALGRPLARGDGVAAVLGDRDQR